MQEFQNIKCVVVGSDKVGKTSLFGAICRYSNNKDGQPMNGYKVHIKDDDSNVDSENYQLEMWDTESGDYLKITRKICYYNADVILMCYSVMDVKSFKDVKRKWQSELKKYCPLKPLILIGTKSDLRDDRASLLWLDRLKNQKPVSIEEGHAMASRIHASSYLECSSKAEVS